MPVSREFPPERAFDYQRLDCRHQSGRGLEIKDATTARENVERAHGAGNSVALPPQRTVPVNRCAKLQRTWQCARRNINPARYRVISTISGARAWLEKRAISGSDMRSRGSVRSVKNHRGHEEEEEEGKGETGGGWERKSDEIYNLPKFLWRGR